MTQEELYIGSTALHLSDKKVKGEYLRIEGETFYKISHYDAMPPFFMTLVSPYDHWLFISSDGALSAGRKNPNAALFPYYTDDKITDSSEITGNKSIFKVKKDTKVYLWEAFSYRYKGVYKIQRNLYKNKIGNKILFEEINEDLQVQYSYMWTFSQRFGIIKKSSFINLNSDSIEVEYLDGIQNILPYGVNSDLQNSVSTLVDAYKKNELDKESGLGIYALSAMIVDKPEPSEALLATTVWNIGLNVERYLLSSSQLDRFRSGQEVKNEEIKSAEKGAYFINGNFTLKENEEALWYIVSDVNQSYAKMVELRHLLKDPQSLLRSLNEEINSCTEELKHLVGLADGIQLSKDKLSSGRHFSNVLFNIMRGGVFTDQYLVDKKDLDKYIQIINQKVHSDNRAFIKDLPEHINYDDLIRKSEEIDDPMLQRICLEYLPLSFSRRHGDPSRPWNQFSIETQDKEGNKIKNYEGNWRDIFQNWEALAISFPEFTESMITKFLNSSTADGYNPYRIMRDGIDWETIEEDNPWSFIGYWGDHQLIYLLKLLEISVAHHPKKLASMLTRSNNVYANVPYKIKAYKDILNDPRDTIEFDHDLEAIIKGRVKKIGADGKMIWDETNELLRANMAEKILLTLLTKISNFIPEGGIWLNTQRPEWNDANNALVGNGVSMVSLYYLYRFLKFAKGLFNELEEERIEFNVPLAEFLETISDCFQSKETLLSGPIMDSDRKIIMDKLGLAGEKYRKHAYQGDIATRTIILKQKISEFIDISIKFVEHSIICNKRKDGLYHSYNLVHIKNNEASIAHLYEMLEGQVAVLSSGYLSADGASDLMWALKNSPMFRPDQYSYLLYPNRRLAGFLEKNTIPKEFIASSKLAEKLLADNQLSIFEKDSDGNFHFNGNFHNSSDLKWTLENLKKDTKYSGLVKEEFDSYLEVFEKMFDHKAFTGRSGTFYAYEGLGSIYWHMVSKLLLSVQENIYKAEKDQVDKRVLGHLIDHYYEVRAGIGINKTPDLYGAFPTDAYSHTPWNAGAQQPGMTGQVKEDVINRWAELGLVVKDGAILFDPLFLKKEEFLDAEKNFDYYTIDNEKIRLVIPPNCMAFTYCQVPVIYRLGETQRIEIFYQDESVKIVEGNTLSPEDSMAVFKRNNTIKKIRFSFSIP